MENELIRKILPVTAIAIVSTVILLAMLSFGAEAAEKESPYDGNPKIVVFKIKQDGETGKIYKKVEITDDIDGIQEIEYGDLGKYTYIKRIEPNNWGEYYYEKETISNFNRFYKNSKFKAAIFSNEKITRYYSQDNKKIPKKTTVRFYARSGGPIEFKLAALDFKDNWEVASFNQKCDYGDAPDPKYLSLYKNKGARHFNCGYEWLGKNVDKENDSKQIDKDNDDGVTFYPPYLEGIKNNLSVVILLRMYNLELLCQ